MPSSLRVALLIAVRSVAASTLMMTAASPVLVNVM